MKSKKAISDVIVSVLMILLVIAAVTILGAVLLNFLKGQTTPIQSQADCIAVQLKISDATFDGTNSVIKVEYSGPKTLNSLKVYSEDSSIGLLKEFSDVTPGESRTVTVGSDKLLIDTKVYAIGAFGTGTTAVICDRQKAPAVTVVTSQPACLAANLTILSAIKVANFGNKADVLVKYEEGSKPLSGIAFYTADKEVLMLGEEATTDSLANLVISVGETKLLLLRLGLPAPDTQTTLRGQEIYAVPIIEGTSCTGQPSEQALVPT